MLNKVQRMRKDKTKKDKEISKIKQELQLKRRRNQNKKDRELLIIQKQIQSQIIIKQRI